MGVGGLKIQIHEASALYKEVCSVFPEVPRAKITGIRRMEIVILPWDPWNGNFRD